MWSRLALLLPFFALASCKNTFSGRLQVTQSFPLTHEVKETWGDQETYKKQKSIIMAGSYEAQLRFYGKTQVDLVINPKSWRAQTYRLELPRSIDWSAPQGEFAFSAKELGQSFALSGRWIREVNESSVVKEWESCEYQDWEWVCDHTGCAQRWVWKRGWHWVEYFWRTTRVDLAAGIKQSAEVARFQGQESWREKVIISQTQCF